MPLESGTALENVRDQGRWRTLSMPLHYKTNSDQFKKSVASQVPVRIRATTYLAFYVLSYVHFLQSQSYACLKPKGHQTLLYLFYFRLGKGLLSQDFYLVSGIINYNFGLSVFIFSKSGVKIGKFVVLTRFRRTSDGEVIPGPEHGFDIVGGYFSADLKSSLSHSLNMHFL